MTKKTKQQDTEPEALEPDGQPPPVHTPAIAEPTAHDLAAGMGGSWSPPGPSPELGKKQVPVAVIKPELHHEHERAHLMADHGLPAEGIEFLNNGAARCLRDPAAPEHGYRFFRQNRDRAWCEV